MTPREDGRRCVGALCAARSPGDSGAAGVIGGKLRSWGALESAARGSLRA